jgi:hypothetical protein
VAVGWIVLMPLLSHLLRPHLPERGVESPTFGQLTALGRLASELLFTGYYPVVAWLAYLLVGLALGRADLRDRTLLVAITTGGLGVAVLATQVSRALVDPVIADEHATGMYGNPPPDGDWSWMLLVAPHSATPFDLAQTTGSALFVIGSCLLVARALPRAVTAVVAVLFGAGTVTLYSLHVLMRTGRRPSAAATGVGGTVPVSCRPPRGRPARTRTRSRSRRRRRWTRRLHRS